MLSVCRDQGEHSGFLEESVCAGREEEEGAARWREEDRSCRLFVGNDVDLTGFDG